MGLIQVHSDENALPAVGPRNRGAIVPRNRGATARQKRDRLESHYGDMNDLGWPPPLPAFLTCTTCAGQVLRARRRTCVQHRKCRGGSAWLVFLHPPLLIGRAEGTNAQCRLRVEAAACRQAPQRRTSVVLHPGCSSLFSRRSLVTVFAYCGQ